MNIYHEAKHCIQCIRTLWKFVPQRTKNLQNPSKSTVTHDLLFLLPFTKPPSLLVPRSVCDVSELLRLLGTGAFGAERKARGLRFWMHVGLCYVSRQYVSALHLFSECFAFVLGVVCVCSVKWRAGGFESIFRCCWIQMPFGACAWFCDFATFGLFWAQHSWKGLMFQEYLCLLSHVTCLFYFE